MYRFSAVFSTFFFRNAAQPREGGIKKLGTRVPRDLTGVFIMSALTFTRIGSLNGCNYNISNVHIAVRCG